MEKTKLFVAHCVERHGEYETTTKRLILAKDQTEAELYAYEEGMPTYDGSDLEDKEAQQDAGQPNTWYFCHGDWCVTLRQVVEIEDREMAKMIVKSGLVSFL
ncbi:hypothetical protein BZF66_05885 [Salmonella enterica]|uniref:hypothetical protein n=1 Tax=Salmonella enterica TaxID=28901 RepID=UPI000FDF7CC6|nr:hypothetical protein CPT_Munch_020 [Salmonella phage Munch]EAR2661062.1 hypothetical protein [Salmonella enterica]ECV9083956.1 hypothetical protein [Salmonella enterica subsp. enterica serovar Infantis]MCP0435947.1 hypothetical protein [Salmonella enterica subsp. enterica serovar Mbandaka]EAZ2022823.1 hypothetical protein [Salmonella enterica]